jgi:(p)ppGpp synthase/HD superfamily hydrolase
MKPATLEDAIALARHEHRNQVDKSGKPYFGHLERVMNSVDGDDVKIVAVLHDILEDTPVTREYLLDHGYSEEIVKAIEGVTKLADEENGEEGYIRFVQRAAQNPISKRVKIADLTDNMDLSRIAEPTDKDHQRLSKYKRALALLQLNS